jgi:antitoxin ParD1/3/4
MNVSLPDPLKDWVEDRVKSGRYANASDYVRDLIRRDQDRREVLVQALIEGEQSGISRRSVREIASDTRAKLDRGEL